MKPDRGKAWILAAAAALAVISLILSAFSIRYAMRTGAGGEFLTIEVIPEEELQGLLMGREQEGGMGRLLFMGQRVPYDGIRQAFFVTQRTDGPDWEGTLTAGDGGRLYCAEDSYVTDKAASLKEGHVFTLYSLSGGSARSYRVVFTGLSALSFRTSREEGDLRYGVMQLFDGRGGPGELLDPARSDASLKKKNTGGSAKGAVNYKLELYSAPGLDRKQDLPLFGYRSDDDWELDSAIGPDDCLKEITAADLWNEIVLLEGHREFCMEMEYTALFVDDVLRGLYLLRVPTDRKSLSAAASDELVESDSLTGPPMDHPAPQELLDYSLFIQAVYAPKNLVKNKYVWYRNRSGAALSYRLPRHLEYLFGYLPDDLMEYTDQAGEDPARNVLRDPLLMKAVSENLLSMEEAAGRWTELRQRILSVENVLSHMEEHHTDLVRAGYYPMEERKNPDGEAEAIREFVTKRLPFLDGWYAEGMREPERKEYFSLTGAGERIRGNEDSEGYVFFLPACLSPEDCAFSVPEGFRVSLNGRPLEDGDSLTGMECGREYPLETARGEKKRLLILRSENLPAVFLTTQSGELDFIHSGRGRYESGTIRILTAEGETGFRGEFRKLKGRGRSSWNNDLGKKPYNLNLYAPADLLNMGASDRWALVANAMDGSMLRNALTYGTARDLHMDYSPEFVFMDLYVNGDYRGTYQLTERIGAGELAEDLGEGGFLIEGNSSLDPDPVYFDTEEGYHVEVIRPEDPGEEELSGIREAFQELESAVYARDGRNPDTGRLYTEIMDVDSFARKYLVEEISKNVDCVRSSSFYYRKGQEGVLFAGPVWDYDIAYGNVALLTGSLDVQRPQGVTELLISHKTTRNLFSELMRHEAFRERVKELYRREFRPYLREMAKQGGGLDALSERISASASMNALRYGGIRESGTLYHTGVTAGEQKESLKRFLSERLDFLDSAWIDGTRYYQVNFMDEDLEYDRRYVRAGETCPDPGPSNFARKDGKTFRGWFDDRGQPFREDISVRQDMEYHAEWGP